MRKFTMALSLMALSAALFLCGFVPPYNTINPPPTLNSGNPVTVWNAETPTPGNGTTAASQQVAIITAPNGLEFEGQFADDPGTFEIDCQATDSDNDSSYATVDSGVITTVDPTNFTFHFDAPFVGAKFARFLMRSRTNSVTITAQILQR